MMKDSLTMAGHPNNKNQHIDTEATIDLRDVNGINNASIGNTDLIKPKESWSDRFVNF